MRAITVDPTIRDSVALEDVPEPPADAAAILVQTLALGLCGTDREIIAAHYGTPAAARALMDCERQFPGWLARLITRRVPLERWQEAFVPAQDDIKVVIDFAPTAFGA